MTGKARQGLYGSSAVHHFSRGKFGAEIFLTPGKQQDVFGLLISNKQPTLGKVTDEMYSNLMSVCLDKHIDCMCIYGVTCTPII